MRRIRWVAASAAVAAVAALLVPAGAQGAAAAPTAVSPAVLAAPPAVVAPASVALAPHIPGATRFDGRVPATVRQVIVISAPRWSSTSGTVTLWQRWGYGWKKLAVWSARLGYGGLVLGYRRVQGTGTTPAGAYAITQAFGRQADPGTALPYTKVTRDHWWVEDRRSPYYNQMRLGSQGGFALRTWGYNSSERLAYMGAQYDYAAVVDFNRPNPVIGRGAGIFLHAFGKGATAGCVSIRVDRMRATLRWLSPAQRPWILLGQSTWLATR